MSAPGFLPKHDKSHCQVVLLSAKLGAGAFEVVSEICKQLAERRKRYGIISFNLIDDHQDFILPVSAMQTYVETLCRANSNEAKPFVLIIPDCATANEFNGFPTALRVRIESNSNPDRRYFRGLDSQLEQIAQAGLFDVVLNIDQIKPREAASEIISRLQSKGHK